MQSIISSVKANSLAEFYGIKKGEKLLSVNGQTITDIIELSYLLADSEISLGIENAEGIFRELKIEKYQDEELGIEFESAVFDKVSTCHNKCVFCFVDQMIPNMRESLYVRDDDYRLSFLYGNFITLTNLKEADFERIISTHMSPLYVSVHATEPDVRRQMMNNRFAGDLMPLIKRLVNAGITIHAQIVCCPGYNDGTVLEKTYHDLAELYPMVETMAVVPVGVTKNRTDLPNLKLFDKKEAEKIVDMVTKWQKDFRLKFNKSFIYLGDEFYLLAERDLPSAEWYDGFPQIENGIGLSRSFLDDWDAIYNKTTSFNKGVDAVIPVGVAAYKVLSPIIKTFNDRAGTEHKLVPVENSFFGSTINVTGLLVGEDILTATKNKKRIILPGKVLNHDNLFLDDMLYDDFVKESKATVEIATTAKDLFILLNR